MSGSGDVYDFSDTIFWFLDENSCLSEISSDGLLDATEFGLGGDGDDEDEVASSSKAEQSKAFWDEQDQLLKAMLCRTTVIESRVRQAIKEALNESRSVCACGKGAAHSGCRSCLRRDVFNRLSGAGYDCSICTSKWSSTSAIPSGEHTYLEVVERKEGKEAVPVRVIVELHFKVEFEMARASNEYNRLISHLPEVFVGKPERLRPIINLLCGAAKRCIKDKKMHLPPWRKHKYMEAKWLSSSTTREMSASRMASPTVEGFSSARPTKPRASMLTFALLENLPRPHCQTVAVV